MSPVKKRFFRVVALVLTLSMFVVGSIPRESMAYVVTGSSSVRQTDMETVQRALESKLVAEKLESIGLTSEEVEGKLAKLGDEELHQLATQIDSLYPGGNDLGIVIALLIIVILVIVILKITDKRIVIK